MLDHVQLAIPPGAEETCRRFYVGLLGMNEMEKPLPGIRRFYVADPFGNRLEFLSADLSPS